MPNPAQRAEPRGIGTSGARDPLAREVKLLGALLGQVIVEQEGERALDLVETVRRATIALRRDKDADQQRQRLARTVEALDLGDLETLIRAFSLYFQLTNLAEEKQRIRRLRQRQRSAGTSGGAVVESVAAAVAALGQQGLNAAARADLFDRLSVVPGADCASDRGAPADAVGRPAPCLSAARPARRPAADTGRGCRDPPPAARGDLDPVAHGADQIDVARAARRGSQRSGRLRRIAVRGHAAPVPRGGSRLSRRGRGRTTAGQGVPALGIVDQWRSRREPECDRSDDTRGDGHPGRSRVARLRAGLSPAGADHHGPPLAGREAREATRCRRCGAAGSRALPR